MFIYYINIPLNQLGIEEFENYADEMPNVKTFELTEEQYSVLRQPGGLFDKFDKQLGTIIDICEEERIEQNKIPEALSIARIHCNKCRNIIEKEAVDIIINSLEIAMKAETFWEIDIYLE